MPFQSWPHALRLYIEDGLEILREESALHVDQVGNMGQKILWLTIQ